MKTTVELPAELLLNAKQYATDHGKTFKEVLVDALNLLIGNEPAKSDRPGWEALFGAFKDDPEMDVVQGIIDEEFSRIDLDEWK